MKKLLAILLVFVLTLSFAACGDDSTDTSGDSASSTVSKSDDSRPVDESPEPDESDKSEAGSEDESDDTSEDEVAEPEYTNKFISWGKHIKQGLTDVTAEQSTSLKLSKINESVVAGDVGLFTSLYGTTIDSEEQDYADFAVAVFEYSHTVFSYVKTAFYAVGEATATVEIPEDGYVVAIYKTYTDKIYAIKALSAETAVFPHGITINNGLDVIISSVATSPKVDGNVTMSEYGAPIWNLEPENELVSFAQFEENNYYATAKVYLTYDSEYLYLGVVVDSPYHSNPLAASGDVSTMWAHESIQVNVLSKGVNTDYISEHWNHHADETAHKENVVRQYGFAVNDNGDTIKYLWFGNSEKDNSVVSCRRDDGAGVTYYEAAIPWADCGADGETVSPEAGTEFAFSVSVNCGDGTIFKNIYLRDGGGIIGINDFTKMPSVTLG